MRGFNFNPASAMRTLLNIGRAWVTVGYEGGQVVEGTANLMRIHGVCFIAVNGDGQHTPQGVSQLRSIT